MTYSILFLSWITLGAITEGFLFGRVEVENDHNVWRDLSVLEPSEANKSDQGRAFGGSNHPTLERVRG